MEPPKEVNEAVLPSSFGNRPPSCPPPVRHRRAKPEVGKSEAPTPERRAEKTEVARRRRQPNSLFSPWEQKVRCSKTPEQEGKLNEEHSAGTRDHYRHPVSWGIPVGYVALGRGQDVGGIRI